MDDSYCRPQIKTVSSSTLASLCTVIARDTALSCEIDSALPVYVAGRAGGVEAPIVAIARDAGIAGTVMAAEAFIDGCVGGCVHGDIVSLGPEARVAGDVVSRELYAAPGSRIGGRTHPSVRLTRKHVADLARIARSRRAVEKIDPEVLNMLMREGLVFLRGKATFVSLFGHLELERRWARTFRRVPGFHAFARAIDTYPLALKLAHEAASCGNAPLTVIADDVTVAGDVRTKGHLHICGDVTGDVFAGSVYVADAARIGGSIEAGEVCLWGDVAANLSAQTVVLHTTARVGGVVAFGTLDARGGARYRSARQHWQDNVNGLVRLAPFRDAAVAIESAITGIAAAA